jgi:hypothetical protein
MNLKRLKIWFAVVCTIMVVLGMVFAVFGLGILPVDRQVLLPWQNAVYGTTFMGWGNNPVFLWVGLPLKALLYGLFVWFPIESVFSAYLGIWFNVGVDVAVLAVLSLPLIIAVRFLDKENRQPSKQ